MRIFKAAMLGTCAATLFAGAASAETLTIGTRNETTSIDPHFYNTSSNHQINAHTFQYLIEKDERQQLKPALAVSWKPINDKVWEIKLRKGVKWTDGSPFTADDVMANVERALSGVVVTTSPSYRFMLGIEHKKIDDYTIHTTTGTVYPLMPNYLSVAPLISRKFAKSTTADYNSGKAAMGTGPYKFVEWIKGDQVVLEKNPDYWGDKPEWDKIVYKVIKSDPSRLAAMLNGDVDLIDYVPTTDYQSVKKNPKLAISETPSNRVIYLVLDQKGPTTPFAKTNDGKEMPNPMLNRKIRKAISLAINRQAIVDRVMEGAAFPAAQFPVSGMFGYDPGITPDAFDPDQAKKLLAEAGYPNGFQLTVHGPNDRYVNDGKITEVIGQMLTKVGIKTKVHTEPKATFFKNAWGYSLVLLGFGSDTGEASSGFTALLHTPFKEKNLGRVNRTGYANPKFDKYVDDALMTLDNTKRKKLLQNAGRVVADDVAAIPTHYQVNVWAHRPDLSYVARTDERTYGMYVKKK
ncbi:MAG: ABC transporter substrate-binding protein [Rhodospirillales bacterium]|jgi:peptide/nickel transport system substrate-binding protein|nr:ABC transporter substrate-binding protein [Rhodospirillales bacterium]